MTDEKCKSDSAADMPPLHLKENAQRAALNERLVTGLCIMRDVRLIEADTEEFKAIEKSHKEEPTKLSRENLHIVIAARNRLRPQPKKSPRQDRPPKGKKP